MFIGLQGVSGSVSFWHIGTQLHRECAIDDEGNVEHRGFLPIRRTNQSKRIRSGSPAMFSAMACRIARPLVECEALHPSQAHVLPVRPTRD